MPYSISMKINEESIFFVGKDNQQATNTLEQWPDQDHTKCTLLLENRSYRNPAAFIALFQPPKAPSKRP